MNAVKAAIRYKTSHYFGVTTEDGHSFSIENKCLLSDSVSLKSLRVGDTILLETVKETSHWTLYRIHPYDPNKE